MYLCISGMKSQTIIILCNCLNYQLEDLNKLSHIFFFITNLNDFLSSQRIDMKCPSKKCKYYKKNLLLWAKNKIKSSNRYYCWMWKFDNHMATKIRIIDMNIEIVFGKETTSHANSKIQINTFPILN